MASLPRPVECEGFLTFLDEYIDGQLDPPEVASVHAHLGECLSCCRELKRARGARTLLRGVDRITPSAAFKLSLLQRLAAEKTRRDRRDRMVRTLVPALAPVAIMAVLVLHPLAPQAGLQPVLTARPAAHVTQAPDTPALPRRALAEPGTDAPQAQPTMAEANAALRAKGVTRPLASPSGSGRAMMARSNTPVPSSAPDRPSAPGPRPDAVRLDTVVVASVAQESVSTGLPARGSSNVPSYVNARLPEATPVAEPAPVLVASVPSPDAVYQSTSQTTWEL